MNWSVSREAISSDEAEIINTLRGINTLEEKTMDGKKIETGSQYVKPEMEVVEISSEYSLITTDCGSCAIDKPDENEPGMMTDF